MYEDEFKNVNNQYHFTKEDHLPEDDYKAPATVNETPINTVSADESERKTEYQNAQTVHYTETETASQPAYNSNPGNGGKKKGKGLKIFALVLAVIVASSCCGIGSAIFYSNYLEKKETAEISQSTREPVEVSIKQVDGKTEMSESEVYASTVNSVVSINCSSTSTNVFGQTTESASSGSGFIITEDGYILTNYHVIDGASTVNVTLYNGDTYPATVIGGDSDYDVAVIKIEATGLQAVVFGDSDSLNVGDNVLAIGNPLGELTFSMSEGIVSCCDRAINVDGTPFNMIQVDCSINPGNSGGPLMNLYGEVVGIVSAKYSTYSSTTVEGLGFAIPINDVQAILTDIIENGEVTNKAYMAIQAYSLTESIAAQYNIDITSGVLVQSVVSGGAGEKAGIQSGDVITKIDDTEITSLTDLSGAKKNYRAGDSAELTVYRDGQYITLTIVFDAQPAVTGSDSSDEDSSDNSDDNSSNIPDNWEEFYNYFFGNGNSNGNGSYPRG